MKFTPSKDGQPRATVNIKYRVSEEDLEIIAFVADGADRTTKFRKATRKEVVDAIKTGYFSDMNWNIEDVDAYHDLRGSR